MNLLFIIGIISAGKFSCSLDLKGLNWRAEFVKKVSYSKYSVKLFRIPSGKLADFSKLIVSSEWEQKNYDPEKMLQKYQQEFTQNFNGQPSWEEFQAAVYTYDKLMTYKEIKKFNTFSTSNTTNKSVPEGNTIRSIIADQILFESEDVLYMAVGFDLREHAEQVVLEKLRVSMMLTR